MGIIHYLLIEGYRLSNGCTRLSCGLSKPSCRRAHVIILVEERPTEFEIDCMQPHFMVTIDFLLTILELVYIGIVHATAGAIIVFCLFDLPSVIRRIKVSVPRRCVGRIPNVKLALNAIVKRNVIARYRARRKGGQCDWC